MGTAPSAPQVRVWAHDPPTNTPFPTPPPGTDVRTRYPLTPLPPHGIIVFSGPSLGPPKPSPGTFLRKMEKEDQPSLGVEQQELTCWGDGCHAVPCVEETDLQRERSQERSGDKGQRRDAAPRPPVQLSPWSHASWGQCWSQPKSWRCCTRVLGLAQRVGAGHPQEPCVSLLAQWVAGGLPRLCAHLGP